MYHLVSYKRSDFSITLVMVSLCITFYNLYMQGWATSGFILNSFFFFCGKYCIFFSNSRLISSLQVFFFLSLCPYLKIYAHISDVVVHCCLVFSHHLPPPLLLFAIANAMFLLRFSNVNLLLLSAIEVLFLLALT